MMIVETNADEEITLFEFLTRRARHSSDARIALDAVVGFSVAISAVLWRGPAWHVLAAAGVCFFAYGAWAISDRELSDPAGATRSRATVLKVVRFASAVTGFGSAVLFVLGAMAIIFGRFIS